MIPIRPFNHLMKITVENLIKKSLGVSVKAGLNPKLGPLILPVLTTLFHLPKLLFKAIGIIPTFKILNIIRKCLTDPLAIVNITTVLETLLTSTNKITKPQIKLIIETLNPIVEEIVKLPEAYAKLFKYFQYFLMFSTLGPIFRLSSLYTLRTCLGLLFSSIGVVWSESLTAITILRDFSLWFISSFESFSGIHIPRGVTSDIIQDSKPEELPDYEKAASFFEIVGMICIGIIVTGTTLVIFDHYHPDTFQNVPYINSFLDMVHNLWSPLHPVVPDAPPANPPAVPTNNPVAPPAEVNLPAVNIPEVISRNSSGGTVTAESFAAGQITPPATPEPVIPNNFE